ncbi:MAG: 4Fe-4S binding protein [Oscillospiraceae bacterium]|jgi:epoxyqueuosine reductase|nr:4Fe-4S binding protein [Oscillospiraceae bacterium]
MSKPQDGLADELKASARALGFELFGAIDPADVEALPDRPQREAGFEPRSIAVLLMPSFISRWQRGQAEVSGFYFISNKAHINTQAWIERLGERGIRAERLGTVRAKSAAARAGLGVVRRNTLLYAPEFGSFHTLQVVALSEAITFACVVDHNDYDVERLFDANECVGCARCAAACPTGALDGRGNINRDRCLRSHMMSGRETPVELRPLIGAKLMGCEACQWACPKQPDIPVRSFERDDTFNVERLLEPTRETLDALAERIGRNYARAARVSAQAALIAGNIGSREYLPALERLSESTDGTIRAHARWARDRIRFGPAKA